MQKVSLLIVIAAVALVAAGSATPAPARPTVTVRVDDSRITSPSRWPAGYVGVRIITARPAHVVAGDSRGLAAALSNRTTGEEQ